MYDINKINWQNDDGVNIPMINDFIRNQFYDKIFDGNVKEKSCIDIGFGTGLLSIMALKHGAKHITAFESNTDRYHLGQAIIDQLDLKSKIDLIHETYDYTHAKTEVIFTETVNGNLWQENLWWSLPRSSGQKFFPGKYWFDLLSVPCPRSFAEKLGSQCPDHRPFDPGIDIDPDFVCLINEMMQVKQMSRSLPSLTPGLNRFQHQIDTTWGWIPWMRLAQQTGTRLARYVLDAEQSCLTIQDRTLDIDWTAKSISFTVDINCKDTCLLVPRVGMCHNNHVLTLDTGHWGPCQFPMILHQYQGPLTINHDVNTGDILYQLG